MGYQYDQHSAVNAQANKLALRSKLGLDTHASTVMLIGGGEGMGKIAAITEALSRRYEELAQSGSILNEE